MMRRMIWWGCDRRSAREGCVWTPSTGRDDHCWRLSVSTASGIRGLLRKLATHWRQIVRRVVIGCIRRIGWSSIEHTDMPEFSKWFLLLRWFCGFSIEFHLLVIYALPINSGTLERSRDYPFQQVCSVLSSEFRQNSIYQFLWTNRNADWVRFFFVVIQTHTTSKILVSLWNIEVPVVIEGVGFTNLQNSGGYYPVIFVTK